jgi:hypothetical protein
MAKLAQEGTAVTFHNYSFQIASLYQFNAPKII